MKNCVKKIVLLLFCSSVFPSINAAVSAQVPLYFRVNKAGFRPHDVKTAVAFGRNPLPAEFRVLDAGTKAAVFTGKATRVSGGWGEFAYHAELNFSSVRREGIYVIEFGSGRSPQYAIRGNVHADIADQLLEFMRQQRCGYNPYVDAVCHSFDGRTAYGPLPPATYINASNRRSSVSKSVSESARRVHWRARSIRAVSGRTSRLHDDINDYSTNEPTMDGTASAILMWAVIGNRQ